MLQKKNHFCSELEGRFFLCINCDEYPKIIREVREKHTDNIIKIELISQFVFGCSIDYQMKSEKIDIKDYYELITCGTCRKLLKTNIIKIGIS